MTKSFDSELALTIYNANLGSTFTSVAIISSTYGEFVFWIGVVALMFLFGKQNTKLLAIELAMLFVVGIVTGEFVKYIAYRPRPFDTVGGIIVARIPEESNSSFPSGHALIVSIGAIFALNKFKGGKKARLASVLLAIEAAIVSYARIYLGVHYPLDVLAGVFLAGAIVFVGLFVLERYFSKLVQWATLLAEKIRVPEIL